MTLRGFGTVRWAGDDGSVSATSVGRQTTTEREREAERRRGRRISDDDLDLDEGFDPGDESDFGLADDTDEDIGLDTSTGFDDSATDLEDDADLDGLGEESEDGWSTDAEEAGDLADDSELDIPAGDEYGWLDDNEPSDDEDLFDPGIEDDALETRDDGGAEGLEDDSEFDDINLADLPELDADAEDEAGANAVESFDELSGFTFADEPSIEVVPGEYWKVLPAQAVRVTAIEAPSAPVTQLLAHEDMLFVCADVLYRVDVGVDRLMRTPLLATGVQSIAATGGDDERLCVAVVARGRVYVSTDAAQSFELFGPIGVAQVAYTHSAAGARLWWRTVRGVLAGESAALGSVLPSDLDGEVLAFHADGKRMLAVLCRQRGRLTLLTSSDAGKRFARQAAPVPAKAAEPEVSLQVYAGAVLLADPTDARCAWLPEGFVEVAHGARGPALLTQEEDDEPFVYACVQHGDAWLIVRHAVRTPRATPLVIASLQLAQLAVPKHLAVSYAEGEPLAIYVAGDGVLLRIDASVEGEELA